MLYNGFLKLLISTIFIKINLELLYNLLFCKNSNTFLKNISSDFSILLYTLSSSTITLLFLVNLIFSQTLTFVKTTSLVFVWFLYLFFFMKSDIFMTVINIWLSTNALNQTLQNGLLNIHPSIIYYLYSSIMLIWLVVGFSKKSYITMFFKKYTLNFLFLLKLTTFGIFLGAFWAAQELNWGGFWSWDPIELSSLFIFLYLSLLCHWQTYSYNSLSKIYKIVSVIFIFYCIIRLGVVNTIHSFIRANNLPVYVMLYSFFIFALYSVRLPILHKIKQFNYFYKNIYVNFFQFIFIFVIFFMFLLVSSTFIDLNKYTNLHPSYVYFVAVVFILFFFIPDLIKNTYNKSCNIKILIIASMCLFFNNICILITWFFVTKKCFKNRTYLLIHIFMLISFCFNHYFLLQVFVFTKKNEIILQNVLSLNSLSWFFGDNLTLQYTI